MTNQVTNINKSTIYNKYILTSVSQMSNIKVSKESNAVEHITEQETEETLAEHNGK